MDRHLQELTAKGMNFHQALASQKGDLNMQIDEVANHTTARLDNYSAMSNLLEQRIDGAVVAAEAALVRLEAQTKGVFEMNKVTRDEDCKIIGSTFEASK